MWKIFKHKYVNSGTLYIIFNHPSGSPKVLWATALTGSQPFDVTHYLMLINKRFESLEMRLIPNVQPCTSVGFKPGSFGSEVEVLTSTVNTLNLVNSWKYSPNIPCIQEVLFGNEIIWKVDHQRSSENLTSFFMEFVIKSKTSQELITSPL